MIEPNSCKGQRLYPSEGPGQSVSSDPQLRADSPNDIVASSENVLYSRVTRLENTVDSLSQKFSKQLQSQRVDFERTVMRLAAAYDAAVSNGYAGSSVAWLDSALSAPARHEQLDDIDLDTQVAGLVASKSKSSDVLEEKFVHHTGTYGVKRIIYVRSTGSDTHDGSSPNLAFRQIHAALDSLKGEGSVIRGKVQINVGPGIFEGGIRLPLTRGSAQDDFIRIVGSVGSNGIPTSIVEHSGNRRIGLLAEDGIALWLKNLKFIGGFSAAVQLTRNVYGWFTNIHVDGRNQGVRGFSISSHSRYYVKGGLIQNLTYAGIDEYFNCSRSFATVGSWQDQMLIKNCRMGLRGKEGCVGHLDFLTVENCEKGIELIQNSVANFRSVALRGNLVGLSLVNSSSHNEGTIVWGEGSQANAREVYSAGSSGELRAIGWSGDDMAASSTVGHRPLFVIANDFTQRTVFGSVNTEVQLGSFPKVIPHAFFRTEGKHFTLVALGDVFGATSDSPMRIVVQVGPSVMGSIALTKSGPVHIEFDVVSTQDRVAYLTRASASVDGRISHAFNRSEDLLSAAASHVSDVTILLLSSVGEQAFRVESIEMWG